MGKAIVWNQRTVRGQKMAALLRSRFGDGVYTSDELSENDSSVFQHRTRNVLLAGHVSDVRLLMGDTYFGKLERPKLMGSFSIDSITGDFLPEVDQLTFGEGEEATIDFLYELKDAEMMGLISTGLYSNPLYMALLSNLIQDETVELKHDFDYYGMLMSKDEQLVPVVVGSAPSLIELSVVDQEKELYETFSSVLSTSLDIIRDMNVAGLEASTVLGDDYVVESEPVLSFDIEDILTFDDAIPVTDETVFDDVVEPDENEFMSIFGDTDDVLDVDDYSSEIRKAKKRVNERELQKHDLESNTNVDVVIDEGPGL